MDQTRRQFLGSASAVAAAGLSVSSQLIGPASAQAKKTVVLASMGPVTGNWDPTSHTTLGQLSFESFIFSHLTRSPMQEGKVDEIQPDLATSWKLIDPNTLEFVLRKGVKFHDGKEFTAEDVKATMQYASQSSRPAAAWYPGPVDVEIVDPYTVRLHTEKYGYPASAYWFVASFLPMLSAKDVADPKISREAAERDRAVQIYRDRWRQEHHSRQRRLLWRSAEDRRGRLRLCAGLRTRACWVS